MIAVIKGDIIASRKLSDPKKWLAPLKELLASWGKSPKSWKLDWGDYFQLEIQNPEEALRKALVIKSLIKSITSHDINKKISIIDVRLAIGIGEKTFSGRTIAESNGPAFIHSGEKFELLRKEYTNLGIKSPWTDFDEELNLYFRLIGRFMDRWTISSANLMQVLLQNSNITQEEIGVRLGIKQNSVSGRYNRAHAGDILEVEKMYRKKLKLLLP
jgi:hypothetical protein